MENAENLRILKKLAGMGAHLAVDDFGTGYSSLSYLHQFPMHSLKIDQSFVKGIGKNSDDTTIVTTIIAMAETLRLSVVAEGVETADQAAFLLEQGCPIAQGFYFSRAVPADAFGELLRAQNGREQLSAN